MFLLDITYDFFDLDTTSGSSSEEESESWLVWLLISVSLSSMSAAERRLLMLTPSSSRPSCLLEPTLGFDDFTLRGPAAFFLLPVRY